MSPLSHPIRSSIFGVRLFLLILLLCTPCSTEAQDQAPTPPAGKNVLVLHGFESNLPIFELTDRSIREALDSGGIGIRNQYFEYMDLGRNPGPEYRHQLTELLRLRYGHRKIDLIVTMYPEAMLFALNEGKTLFQEAPILALYLPVGFEMPKSVRRIIPQFVVPDITGTLEIALKLVPGAKRVYVVSGAHPVDRGTESRARQDWSHLEGRLEFHYLSSLPLEEILATVSKAPPESIVLLMGILTDVTGRSFTTREVARKVSQRSSAPVFGLYDVALGHGLTGGSLISFEHIGAMTGELALNILRGDQEKIPDTMNTAALPMFDWRELRRWNLDESVLPKGSVVINREWTLWDYKYYIVGGLALGVIQWLLIAGLLAQRRRMARADESLKERLQFEHLVSDISAGFLTATHHEIDLEIDTALKDIVDFFRASRCLLLRGFPDEHRAVITHSSHAEDVPPIPLGENLYNLVPWTFNRMAQGKPVHLTTLDDLPVEAAADRAFLQNLGVRSLLMIPILIKGSSGHAICISSRLEDRVWPEEYVPRLELLGEILVNTVERQQAELKLKEQLRFEELLSDISARFVNLPTDQLDNVIQETHRRVCEQLGLDRSSLWQVSAGHLTLTHVHRSEEKSPIPVKMDAQEHFPWCLKQLIDGKVIVLDSIENAPAEAARDKEEWRRYGTKSSLIIPLQVGGEPLLGAMTFAVTKEERAWPETFVNQLQLLAQVFANAIARKRADLGLREREARLTLATNAAGAGLWIMELDTREVWVSARSREMFYFAPDEKLTFESYFKVIHPDDHEAVQQAVQQTLRSGGNLSIDYRIVLPDGSTRWIAARGQPYPRMEPNRLMGVAMDITDRKRAEQAMEEQLEFERFLSDLVGRIAAVSSERLESEIEDALERIREFFHVDGVGLLTASGDRASWRIVHAALAEGMPALPLQTDLPRTLSPWLFERIVDLHQIVSVREDKPLPPEAVMDKETLGKWDIGAALNIPIVRGENVGCMTIISQRCRHGWPDKHAPRLRLIGDVLFDALGRMGLEERIRKAAEEWQATFDSIPDVVMILDQDLRILRHNAAAVSLFGLSPEKIQGRHCHLLMHGRGGEPVDCPSRKALSTKVHQENEMYDAGRNAWFLFSSDPITSSEGKITLIVHRIKDITVQKNAEIEAAQFRRKMQQSERLLRMGELTGSLAHELNQPLTATISNAKAAMRFAESGTLDIGELKEILEDIANDNKRAGDIVRSLRSMFKQEEGERETVEVNLLLGEVVALFKSEAVIRNLRLETEFTNPLPPVHINKVQVQQVVINLLMNAAESIPDATGDRTIRLRTHRSETGSVRVEVRDTGSGVAEEDLTRIFDLFFSRKRSGLGMGLAISKTILQTHGGRIWAENNKDVGSTFFFELPAAGRK